MPVSDGPDSCDILVGDEPAALADEAPPSDPRPRLLAAVLAATFRAVVTEIRRKLAAGEEIEAVRAEVTAAAEEMFAALEGL